MKKQTGKELILVTAVTYLLVFFFHQLIRRDISDPLNQVGILGIPLVFIYFPYAVTRFSGKNPEHYGFTLKETGKSVALALKTALVVLPIFMVGYWLFWGGIVGKTVSLHLPGIELLAWNLIGISFPEEFFFRGYLQTRLTDLTQKRIRIWKTDIGWSVVIASILFAFAHLLTSFHPARLAVFFPALIFGWVRERSGSIIGPTVIHWLANGTLLLLEGRL